MFTAFVESKECWKPILSSPSKEFLEHSINLWRKDYRDAHYYDTVIVEWSEEPKIVLSFETWT